MKDKLQLAKEMFFKYQGSHFFMSREDDYKKYKKFNVSREQEFEWICEYQQRLLNDINCLTENGESIEIKVSILLTILEGYRKVDIIPLLVDTLTNPELKLDSFSKVVIAEVMLETTKSLEREKKPNEIDIINTLKDFAINMLHNVINNPISVDPVYKSHQYLREVIKEPAIIERVRRSLMEWDK